MKIYRRETNVVYIKRILVDYEERAGSGVSMGSMRHCDARHKRTKNVRTCTYRTVET